MAKKKDKTPAAPDPMTPGVGLLAKLGSIVVHADEMLSPDGHHFDRTALEGAIRDPEVAAWVAAMERLSLVPVKRRKP